MNAPPRATCGPETAWRDLSGIASPSWTAAAAFPEPWRSWGRVLSRCACSQVPPSKLNGAQTALSVGESDSQLGGPCRRGVALIVEVAVGQADHALWPVRTWSTGSRCRAGARIWWRLSVSVGPRITTIRAAAGAGEAASGLIPDPVLDATRAQFVPDPRNLSAGPGPAP